MSTGTSTSTSTRRQPDASNSHWPSLRMTALLLMFLCSRLQLYFRSFAVVDDVSKTMNVFGSMDKASERLDWIDLKQDKNVVVYNVVSICLVKLRINVSSTTTFPPFWQILNHVLETTSPHSPCSDLTSHRHCRRHFITSLILKQRAARFYDALNQNCSQSSSRKLLMSSSNEP